MDAEQRERLLLARSDELEREYGDLVRALDAAYEAVRSINAALAENRAESRRVFQERLTVAASPKENGLLGCRNGNGDAGAGNNSVRLLRRYVAKKLQCGDATVTGPTVRLADQTMLFEKSVVPGTNATSSSNGGRCDSAVRLASDAMIAPNIVYQQQQQRTTAVNHHHHHHNRPTTTAAQLQQQSAARGAYVGDEHSYAEKDGSDESRDEEEPVQPAPAAGILNGGAPTWHAVFHGEEDNRVTAEEEVTHGEMDLSIVKCEWPDETSDSTCPTSTTTIASPIIQPQPTTTTTSSEAKPVQPKSGVKTIGRLIAISATLTQSPRKRGRPPTRWRSIQEEDEELKRKRRQTRDRMRRWRAKKRLERQLMIGKHGM